MTVVTAMLRTFLGFKFLTRNEEKNEFPHEERGIFEEALFCTFQLFVKTQIDTDKTEIYYTTVRLSWRVSLKAVSIQDFE